MTYEVQMDYSDLEELATTFREGAAGFAEALAIIKEIKAIVAHGALHGNAGNRFIDIIDSKFVGKIKSGEDKFAAIAKEIDSVMSNMQQTDEAISHMF
jgi:hypothetical protein